ncbi:MAG: ABC transporter substrate binding protein [Desulfobulbales bacterium]|nr:ABC transporter substrate binding protein [Desulfobulbales bacterium]
MKRLLLGVAALLLSTNIYRTAEAEMVGALMPAKDIPYYVAIHESMTGELQNLNARAEIVLQRPSPTVRAWSNATRKLVILGSEVIVAYGSATAICVGDENADIPVVYSGAYKPAGCGVSGKVTGMESTLPLDGLVDNLKKISGFSTLAILYAGNEQGSVMQMEEAAALAAKAGAEVVKIDVADSNSFDLPDVDAAFLTVAAAINQKENLEAIIKSARAKKIATASVLSGTCELGVLISLAANPEHQGRGTAKMVAEILNGKSPKDIPPDKNPEAEMTINLKEAKELGFSVPFELLGTAKLVK